MNIGQLQNGQHLKMREMQEYILLFSVETKCTGKQGGKTITVRSFVIRRAPKVKTPAATNAIRCQLPGPDSGGLAASTPQLMVAVRKTDLQGKWVGMTLLVPSLSPISTKP